MTQFSNSPYEYEMKWKPKGGRPPGSSLPRYPPGHKCFQCPYGYGRPCIGLCIKEITKK